MSDLIAIIEFVATAVWRTWPLFLASIVLSVLIRALKLDGLIRRAFSANVGKAILLATLVGAFSPFCSCTVVPIIAGLLLSGVPLAPVMSFWIASPTMDPEIFTLSVGILGWPLALARLFATLAISLLAGYVTLALTNAWQLRKVVLPARMPGLSLASAVTGTGTTAGPATSIPLPLVTTAAGATTADTCTSAGCGNGETADAADEAQPGNRPVSGQEQRTTPLSLRLRQLDWRAFGRETAKQSWSLGRWLLLAFVMEALITRYVPQAAVASFLGADNALAVPLAALVGIPLYLNNFSALPIVSGLLAQGMQPGAAIAFLIAGPVTTIPAMTAVYGVVRRRVFALYLAISLSGAIVAGGVVNLLLG